MLEFLLMCVYESKEWISSRNQFAGFNYIVGDDSYSIFKWEYAI